MKRFSVLVSGGGTNLQSLIDHVEGGKIDAAIASVISSQRGAYALERAKKHGIKTRVIERKAFASKTACDQALLCALEEDGADFVVLAGYLSILGPAVVQAYKNRILNVHPALLPSFGGKGYYGIHVHEAVIQAGETVTGATVHFVDEGTDTGPIIVQRRIPVQQGDTPEILQKRVMKIEHAILPKAVQWMAKDCLRVQGNQVIIKEEWE